MDQFLIPLSRNSVSIDYFMLFAFPLGGKMGSPDPR